RQMLVRLSEGYPHFIQQFGFSAFEADTDHVIEITDVMNGAFGEHGALHQIGERYYRDDYYNKVQQESYRQGLTINHHKLDDWVTKPEIRKAFKGKSSTLDNAIHALLSRNIIMPKEGAKGVYRLQHKGFSLWISLQTGGALALMSEPTPLQGTVDDRSESLE